MSLFGLKYHQRIEIEKMIKNEAEKKNPVKKKSEKETTTKQQLLILHYLGIIDLIDVPETTKKANLLSVLLNRDKQNIRDTLTYIDSRKIEGSEIKTIENISAILPIFEEVGLNEIVLEIKSDLDKQKTFVAKQKETQEKIKWGKTL